MPIEGGIHPITSIATLEGQLGVRLMHRTTRSLHLAEEGRIYLSFVAQALDLLTEAHSAVRDRQSEAKGPARIAVPFTFGKTRVLPALHDFLERYQDISVEVIFADYPSDLVQHGLDLALHFGRPSNQGYISTLLYRVPAGFAASPSYLDAHGIPRTPEDLQEHQFVKGTDLADAAVWRIVPAEGSTQGTDGAIVIRNPTSRIRVAPHHDSHYAAARAGLGIITVDLSMIREDLEAGRLRVVLPEYRIHENEPQGHDLQLVYPAREFMPYRITLLKELLIDVARQNALGLANFLDSINEPRGEGLVLP